LIDIDDWNRNNTVRFGADQGINSWSFAKH
jgi:hypothetical protein